MPKTKRDATPSSSPPSTTTPTKKTTKKQKKDDGDYVFMSKTGARYTEQDLQDMEPEDFSKLVTKQDTCKFFVAKEDSHSISDVLSDTVCTFHYTTYLQLTKHITY